MIRTKLFVLFVMAVVYARGAPLHEESEKTPPKSEIMSRIKRLLQMLREKEQEAVATGYEPRAPIHHSLVSERKRMLERRKKLESLLKRSPGLRTLLKTVIEKRKKKEVMQNDPQCIPGLFYCRDESIDEDSTRKQEHLKMLQNKQDASPYCPPGFFYCPENSDEPQLPKKDRLDLLDAMFPKNRKQQRSKEMQELDRLVQLVNKDKVSQDHRVEVVTIPAAVRKIDESDEAKKAQSKHGEKLADDLVKSLQDTEKKIIDKPSNDKESNFDIKQLIELLQE